METARADGRPRNTAEEQCCNRGGSAGTTLFLGPRGRRQIGAPGEQPEQMKGPEIEARHGVVVAWITQVQKAQQVLVDEIEPEKAAVGAGFAVHREVEVGRIPQCGEDMPGSGDRQQQRHPGQGGQPAPVPLGKEHVQQAGGDGKQRGDQSLEQQSDPDAGPHQISPAGRMRFLVLHRAKQRPQGQRDRQRQGRVGNR